MTVDECLQMFSETGITSFLPSAVATATGLDQDIVCERLRELLQEGSLKLLQQVFCPVCTVDLGVFEENLMVPSVMFCSYCQQNRAVVQTPLLCFPDAYSLNDN